MTKIFNGKAKSNYNYKIDVSVYPQRKVISNTISQKNKTPNQIRSNSSENFYEKNLNFPPIKKNSDYYNKTRERASKIKSVAKYPVNKNLYIWSKLRKNNDLKNLGLSYNNFQATKILEDMKEEIPKQLLYKKSKVLAKEKFLIELLKVGE